MVQGCLAVALCRPVRAMGFSAKEDASRGREAFCTVALQLSCQLTRQLPYCPPNMYDPARLEMDLETRRLRWKGLTCPMTPLAHKERLCLAKKAAGQMSWRLW